MDATEFRRRGREMVDYVADYLDTISSRRVLPEVKPGYLSAMLPDHAPVKQESWTSIMDDVNRAIMPGVCLLVFFSAMPSWHSHLCVVLCSLPMFRVLSITSHYHKKGLFLDLFTDPWFVTLADYCWLVKFYSSFMALILLYMLFVPILLICVCSKLFGTEWPWWCAVKKLLSLSHLGSPRYT